MEAVNLNNLSVDSSGRVIFSGLSSGIDVQGIVTNIIAAKRIPIDSIETRITENADQIAALGDLRALLTSLRQSLYSLRGAVTLGNTGDVFAAKQVFATTSRTDGDTPTAAGNLIGVTTTNAAAPVCPPRWQPAMAEVCASNCGLGNGGSVVRVEIKLNIF